MKLFLSTALTHVPREYFDAYAQFQHRLATGLETQVAGCRVEYALKNSDPQLAARLPEDRARLCYEWDRSMVEHAQMLIAECSFPSIGVGMELQIANERRTPIVLCYGNYGQNPASPVRYRNPDGNEHDLQIGDGSITLMALGLPRVVGVVRYNHLDHAIESIVPLVIQHRPAAQTTGSGGH